MKQLADGSGGTVEVTDPNAMPEASFNWAGIGFRKADQAFLDKFNAAQKGYRRLAGNAGGSCRVRLWRSLAARRQTTDGSRKPLVS